MIFPFLKPKPAATATATAGGNSAGGSTMAPVGGRPPEKRVAASRLAGSQVAEPKDIPARVKAIEADPQFLLGKLAIKALVESARFNVEVQAPPALLPAAQALADNQAEQFRRALPKAFEAFGFGRAAFERWCEYSRTHGLHLLAGLDALPFENTAMRTDAGQYDGVTLTVDGKETAIPAGQTWWFALDPTLKNPHGRSRYDGAPMTVWKARQLLDRNEEIWQKKFAAGHGVAKAPSVYPPGSAPRKGTVGQTNQDGSVSNPMQDVADMLVEVGSGGVAVLDSAVDPVTNQPLFTYDPPQTRQDATPLENRRKVLDAYALRSLGVPERAVTQDEEGSMAMAKVHRKVLGNTAEGVFGQIARSFQEHVMADMVRLNFGDSSGVSLSIVWPPFDDDRTALVVELVKAIIASPALSPLVTEGVLDLAQLLEIADLPVGDNLEQRIAAVKAAVAAQAAATAQPGAGAMGGLAGAFAGARVAARVLARPDDERQPRGTVKMLADSGTATAAAPAPPPDVDSWDAYAERAGREAAELVAEILAAGGDHPSQIDRGRLRQGDSGVPPPA